MCSTRYRCKQTPNPEPSPHPRRAHGHSQRSSGRPHAHAPGPYAQGKEAAIDVLRQDLNGKSPQTHAVAGPGGCHYSLHSTRPASPNCCFQSLVFKVLLYLRLGIPIAAADVNCSLCALTQLSNCHLVTGRSHAISGPTGSLWPI